MNPRPRRDGLTGTSGVGEIDPKARRDCGAEQTWPWRKDVGGSGESPTVRGLTWPTTVFKAERIIPTSMCKTRTRKKTTTTKPTDRNNHRHVPDPGGLHRRKGP